jgi:hypothetical protein
VVPTTGTYSCTGAVDGYIAGTTAVGIGIDGLYMARDQSLTWNGLTYL